MAFQLVRTMTGVPPSLWGTLSCDSQDRAGKYRKVETRNNLRVLGCNLFLWAPDEELLEVLSSTCHFSCLM